MAGVERPLFWLRGVPNCAEVSLLRGDEPPGPPAQPTVLSDIPWGEHGGSSGTNMEAFAQWTVRSLGPKSDFEQILLGC